MSAITGAGSFARHTGSTSDVIVVGGSTAGSMLGVQLRQLGHEVAIVERRASPIAGRRFGVPPATLDLWAQAGLLDKARQRFPGLHMDQLVNHGSGHPLVHATPPYAPRPDLVGEGDMLHLLASLQGRDARGGAIIGIDEVVEFLRGEAVDAGASLSLRTSFEGAEHVGGRHPWRVVVQAADGVRELRGKALAFADGGRVSRDFIGAGLEQASGSTYYVGSQFANDPAAAPVTQLAKRWLYDGSGRDPQVLFAHTHPRERPEAGSWGTIGWFQAPHEWAQAAGRDRTKQFTELFGEQLPRFVDEHAPLLGIDPARRRGDALVAPVYGQVATRAVGRADQPGVYVVGDALGVGDISGGSFGNLAQYDAKLAAHSIDRWLGTASPQEQRAIELGFQQLVLAGRSAVVDDSLVRFNRSARIA